MLAIWDQLPPSIDRSTFDGVVGVGGIAVVRPGHHVAAVVLPGVRHARCPVSYTHLCGGGASGGSDGSTSDAPQQEEQKKPLDLSGEWKQVNSKSEDSYQEATIQDNVIEINWVSDGGDTKSLYWSGTYEAPTEATESYTWDSVNDTSKTANALLCLLYTSRCV